MWLGKNKVDIIESSALNARCGPRNQSSLVDAGWKYLVLMVSLIVQMMTDPQEQMSVCRVLLLAP